MGRMLSSYLIDRLEPYAKWVTISIIAMALIGIVVLFFVKKNNSIKPIKAISIGVVFYCLALGVLLLSLEISKKYSTAYLQENWVDLQVVKLVFIPLLITLISFLLFAVVAVIVKQEKTKKVCIKTFGFLCIVSVLASLITIFMYYTKNISNDGYYSEKLNNMALYISMILLFVFVVISALFLGRKQKNNFTTREIAFAGISIAISFVLSYIRLFKMPQGGSITLVSMLPIMIFAYVYGCKKGIVVGGIYGLLQAIQDPFIIHPAQFLLDYPLAFAMVGFCGVLNNVKGLKSLPQIKFVLGGIICGILRFFSHVLSGVFAFGAYAEGQNVLAYSLAYNSFVFVDIAIVLVVGAMVFSSKVFQRVIAEKQVEISTDSVK